MPTETFVRRPASVISPGVAATSRRSRVSTETSSRSLSSWFGRSARTASNASSAVGELLDDREDVVPAAGVEPRGVLAELVQDLVHLEGREDRLDQDGRLYRP